MQTASPSITPVIQNPHWPLYYGDLDNVYPQLNCFVDNNPLIEQIANWNKPKITC
jgi:hypothetical protein